MKKKMVAEAAVITVWRHLEAIERMRNEIKTTVSLFDPEKPENVLHRDCAAFHDYMTSLGLGDWIMAETQSPWGKK